MYNCNYLSVGIDVGSAFSFMSVADPAGNLIGKPFRITHDDPDSLERALMHIRKAEERHSKKSHIFLESTGIYHFPLFCFLIESGFEAFILNPLITHSTKNRSIRKVKNDKLDSKAIAKLGLDPDLKVSLMPVKLVLELRSLTRKYYSLVDERSSHINQLKSDLHIVFPQYAGIFSDVTGAASTMILKDYGTPDKILRAHRNVMIAKIAKASRKGTAVATQKYEKLVSAAKAAKVFGCDLDSVHFNISLNLNAVEFFNKLIDAVMLRIRQLTDENPNEEFVRQIHLLDSIPGIGFLTAVTIMGEIGDFSVFKSPKQLFAYFGMDPEVNQSGKFTGSQVHMSKRGSRIARRAIFAAALACIRVKRNGDAIHPYLHEYYQKKIASKAKKVALGAVMHHICNYIFAVLRDGKPFELRSPEQHRQAYTPFTALAA